MSDQSKIEKSHNFTALDGSQTQTMGDFHYKSNSESLPSRAREGLFDQ